MKKTTLQFALGVFVALILIALTFPSGANAQRRDYMTDPESELVRDAQEIDRRVDVLTKMIDRRFAVLNNQPSPISKDAEKWGDAPTGTRLELLSDVSKLLQKSIDDIDDVAAHNRMDSKLFPKAMSNLSEAASRYLLQLRAAYDKAENEKEKGTILGSIDFCNQIIEASAKVPKEAPKDDKKKKSKNDTD